MAVSGLGSARAQKPRTGPLLCYGSLSAVSLIRRTALATFTERVTVTLPVDVKNRLRERARRNGVSLSAVMRDIVDGIVAEHRIANLGNRLERKVIEE